MSEDQAERLRVGQQVWYVDLRCGGLRREAPVLVRVTRVSENGEPDLRVGGRHGPLTPVDHCELFRTEPEAVAFRSYILSQSRRDAVAELAALDRIIAEAKAAGKWAEPEPGKEPGA